MRANHLVAVQHALQRADRRSQHRHAENALIPGRRLETIGTLGAIAAGETQGQVPTSAVEKADAEAAAGENSVMRFGA